MSCARMQPAALSHFVSLKVTPLSDSKLRVLRLQRKGTNENMYLAVREALEEAGVKTPQASAHLERQRFRTKRVAKMNTRSSSK